MPILDIVQNSTRGTPSEVGWYSLHKLTDRRTEGQTKTRWNQYTPTPFIFVEMGVQKIKIPTFLLIVLRALETFYSLVWRHS